MCLLQSLASVWCDVFICSQESLLIIDALTHRSVINHRSKTSVPSFYLGRGGTEN